MGPEPAAGVVAFLFTDVEGSTRLLEELGAEGYAAANDEHRRVVREAVTEHGGREISTHGDAFFCVFGDAGAAVGAALALQEGLVGGPIRVRVGVHVGEAVVADGTYHGLEVNRAARIMDAGHGGQVVVSEAVHAAIGKADLALVDLGEHRLKDMGAPVRLYQAGAGEFPPLRTLYRSNLPVPATVFLGRERELREVAGLLADPAVRLVSLTGPGGTGKTRLALHAAAEAADRFRAGVWWVPLASVPEPALALDAVARALDVVERPGRSPVEALAERLAGAPTLLVLDNVEHLLPPLALEIASLMDACRDLTLLATSRERLQLSSETVVAVPSLTERDAVELFVARARVLGSEVEHGPLVAELCARLDHLPLAIELAAARTTVFDPRQLLERLSGRLDLLKGARDADPRQQMLRATIDWSYDLLTEEERRVFRALSIFVAGCTYPAAEAVAEADADTLQSLLDKSLIRIRDASGGRRYWMLETTRAYAAEVLEANASERGAAVDRYIRFAHELSAAAEPAWLLGTESEWVPRLEDELPDLRHAVSLALEGDRATDALAIATSLGWLWHHRGYYSEGLRLVASALQASPDAEPGLRGYAEWLVAILSAEKGLGEGVAERIRRGLELLERGGPAYAPAHVLALSHLALFCEDGVEASAALERCERDALALGYDTLISVSRLGRAQLEAQAGDLDGARELLHQALEPEISGAARAVVLGVLAALDVPHGDLDRARRHLEQALASTVDSDYTRIRAPLRTFLGYVDLLSGRLDEADAHFSEARTLAELSGSTPVLVSTAIGQAAAAGARGEPDAVSSWRHWEATIGDHALLDYPWREVEQEVISRYLVPLARDETAGPETDA